MAGVVHTVAIPITLPHRKKGLHLYLVHIYRKSSSVFCSLKLCMWPYTLNQMHKWYYNNGADCLKYIVEVRKIKTRYVSKNWEVDMTQFSVLPLDKGTNHPASNSD